MEVLDELAEGVEGAGFVLEATLVAGALAGILDGDAFSVPALFVPAGVRDPAGCRRREVRDLINKAPLGSSVVVKKEANRDIKFINQPALHEHFPP